MFVIYPLCAHGMWSLIAQTIQVADASNRPKPNSSVLERDVYNGKERKEKGVRC